MRTISLALAATMLLLTPIGASSSAIAGVAAGGLSEVIPLGVNSAIQEVRQRRRSVRYERRMRHDRRVRHERRAVRRCIRSGYCPVVYILVPVYYTVPIWYSAPIYYYHY